MSRISVAIWDLRLLHARRPPSVAHLLLSVAKAMGPGIGVFTRATMPVIGAPRETVSGAEGPAVVFGANLKAATVTVAVGDRAATQGSSAIPNKEA
jgi:hypothetical protein